MRILYDGNVYALQSAGGISRYFASLVSRLPRDFEPSLVVRGALRRESFPAHPRLKIYDEDRLRLQSVSYRLGLYLSKLENPLRRAALEIERFDVFHPTYYTLLGGRDITRYRRPMVITVWDMIHELFPEELDPEGKHAEEKRRAILSAERVVCISENTKRDLLERHRVPESRVAVTHLASELDESLAHGPERVPSRPYYLYVGRREGYKNFDGLLEAFARAVAADREPALCVVGGGFDESEQRRIAEMGLTDRVEHYGQPSDAQLAKLYRCSVALVYPSLYEGFGLPPLEAMACGGVAVAARTSSIPEVVGDAGLLYDPSRPDDLVDILRTLARDDAGRSRLVEAGRLQAKKFSWERTAEQTAEVYRAAAG